MQIYLQHGMKTDVQTREMVSISYLYDINERYMYIIQTVNDIQCEYLNYKDIGRIKVSHSGLFRQCGIFGFVFQFINYI